MKKMIAQTILKTNGSSEAIKTYLLSLKQKISLLALIAVDKINIIFGRRLRSNIKPLIHDNNKSLLILNQILLSKAVSLLKYS